MKRVFCKVGAFVIMSSLIITLFTGCGGKNESKTTTVGTETKKTEETQTTAEQSPKLEQRTLKFVFPGDEPKGQQEVNQAIENASEEEVNIKLEYTFIPWDQYWSKLNLYAASGEPFDITWHVPQVFGQYVAKNGLAPLTEALEKYGAAIKKSIPDYLFKAATIDGKIYGIPSVIPQSDPYGVIIREDLRLKYNLPEIKTLADYETYMEGIKKNEPNMIPLVPRGTDAVYILDREYGRATRLFGDHYGPVYVDPTDKELKAKSYFESETFKQIVKKMEEWQKKGYLSKDIMTMKDKHAQFTSGKAGSAEGHVFDVTQREEEARALIPEVKMKIYLLNPDKPKYVATNAFDLLCIGAKSQNVERAVMFLNWVYSKQENYDLFSYGIENKNFTIKDKRIEYSTDNRYAPINWAWYNVNLVRFGVNDRQESIDTLLNWDNGAVVSEIAGFNFSQENVKAEIAQISTVDKELAAPMLAGILSYDEYYPQLIDKLKKAGLEKLLDDAQKQLDAFKAGKQ